MFAKNMNGRGMEMCHPWFHVPLYYTGIMFEKKELVIVNMTKNKVAITLKNNDTYRVGMVKHVPLIRTKRGTYFMYKGKKVYLGQYGWVM